VENTNGYYLDVAEDADFVTMVSGFDGLDVGLVSTYGVTGLISPLSYYYRVRAYNEYGSSDDSNTMSATTLMEVVLDYDNNLYTYVTIGTQQWLVQNLITTHYNDGTAIPNVTAGAGWSAEDGSVGHDGAYCWYDNDSVTNAVYGCLYNWYAVDNAKGIAPTGWRVPSDADLLTMITYLGGVNLAGAKLKEMGLTHWKTPNTGALDSYGFKSLPSGTRQYTGDFAENTERNYLWSTTARDASNAYQSYLIYNSGAMTDATTYSAKRYGFSVRCMRDL
jgi:uncharacterized protein (TIGR02145 family)